jgi:hypothetical protein
MAKRTKRRTLLTVWAELEPGFVAREFRAVPAGEPTEQLALLLTVRLAQRHRISPDAVIVDTKPEPKVSYRWRPGRGELTKIERDAEIAEKYARWLAARDGVSIPHGKIRVDWRHVYGEHRTRPVKKWDGTIRPQQIAERRACAVEWGHEEEVYNTRKDGKRGAWLYNQFVADLRIEIPNWDFDPAEPTEELLPSAVAA